MIKAIKFKSDINGKDFDIETLEFKSNKEFCKYLKRNKYSETDSFEDNYRFYSNNFDNDEEDENHVDNFIKIRDEDLTEDLEEMLIDYI